MWTRNFDFNGLHLRVEEEWGLGIGTIPIRRCCACPFLTEGNSSNTIRLASQTAAFSFMLIFVSHQRAMFAVQEGQYGKAESC